MAHIGKELVQAIVPLYDGLVHGDDGYFMDVEFESLIVASLCIHNHFFEEVTRVRSDENGVSQTSFNKKVVIQFKIKEDEDA